MKVFIFTIEVSNKIQEIKGVYITLDKANEALREYKEDNHSINNCYLVVQEFNTYTQERIEIRRVRV